MGKRGCIAGGRGCSYLVGVNECDGREEDDGGEEGDGREEGDGLKELVSCLSSSPRPEK